MQFAKEKTHYINLPFTLNASYCLKLSPTISARTVLAREISGENPTLTAVIFHELDIGFSHLRLHFSTANGKMKSHVVPDIHH